jgi:hypothetical protein
MFKPIFILSALIETIDGIEDDIPTHFLLSVALALNGIQFVLCVREITQIIKC